MLNVLIVEDNIPISIHLSNIINTKHVRCVGILNEGSKVYQKIKELKADVLILDLKMKGKNGLDILEEIEADKQMKIQVIIYSGEIDYMGIARKYTCVDRFYSKITPPEEIARVLEEYYESIENTNKGEKIQDILFTLGFTYSLKGTQLITECILYSIVKRENNLGKIYYELAKQKGVNVHTIKSDINTAINNMWRYTDKNKARKILRIGEYNKPSNKDVISMVKYYVEK